MNFALQVQEPAGVTQEWDNREVYCTPEAVVFQGLHALRCAVRRARPFRAMIDLAAGAGVFGDQARALSMVDGAFIDYIEPRLSERPWLAAKPGEVYSVEFDAPKEAFPYTGGHDLITSNPPFTLARPMIEWSLRQVADDGLVMFLLRKTWGEARDDAKWLRENPPMVEMTIGGRIRFRPRVEDKAAAAFAEAQEANRCTRLGIPYQKGLVEKRWKAGAADNCGHRWLVWSPRWSHHWTMKVDLPQMPSAWLKWDGEPPGRREWSPHPEMHNYLLEQPLGLMP